MRVKSDYEVSDLHMLIFVDAILMLVMQKTHVLLNKPVSWCERVLSA